MNWVDASILIVTGLSFFFGIWRGLVREVLSLVSWVVAFLMARNYSEVVADVLFNSLDNLTVRYMAAFALIFIGIMMIGAFVTFLMSKILIFTGLSFVDRVLGGLFGIARGVLIVMVGLFFSSFFFPQEEYWQQSKLIPYGQTMIEMSRGFIQDRSDTEVS